MALICKSRLKANFTEAHRRPSKQFFRSLKPSLQQVLMRAGAGGLFEERGEVERAQAGGFSQFVQVDIASEICLDIFKRPAKASPR